MKMHCVIVTEWKDLKREASSTFKLNLCVPWYHALKEQICTIIAKNVNNDVIIACARSASVPSLSSDPLCLLIKYSDMEILFAKSAVQAKLKKALIYSPSGASKRQFDFRIIH